MNSKIKNISAVLLASMVLANCTQGKSGSGPKAPAAKPAAPAAKLTEASTQGKGSEKSTSSKASALKTEAESHALGVAIGSASLGYAMLVQFEGFANGVAKAMERSATWADELGPFKQQREEIEQLQKKITKIYVNIDALPIDGGVGAADGRKVNSAIQNRERLIAKVERLTQEAEALNSMSGRLHQVSEEVRMELTKQAEAAVEAAKSELKAAEGTLTRIILAEPSTHVRINLRAHAQTVRETSVEIARIEARLNTVVSKMSQAITAKLAGLFRGLQEAHTGNNIKKVTLVSVGTGSVVLGFVIASQVVEEGQRLIRISQDTDSKEDRMKAELLTVKQGEAKTVDSTYINASINTNVPVIKTTNAPSTNVSAIKTNAPATNAAPTSAYRPGGWRRDIY